MQRERDSKSAENSRFEFETQASAFDARAHLGVDAARLIADAVLALAPRGRDEVMLEIGAGTGEIGVEIARRAERYVGVDASRAMLDVFAARGLVREGMLHVADANAPWPVDDASVGLVFMSRVAHLLDPEHVIRELLRVRRGAFVFVVGRRRRSPESPWRLASTEARALLEAHGLTPKRGDRAGRQLVLTLESLGAEAVDAHTVFTQGASASFRTVLEAWHTKGGLAGLDLSASLKQSVIEDVTRILQTEHGSLETVHTYEERYVLDVARFRV